ncbi:MAG TPA: lysine--tRNA ligase, partial [Candidatus Nanopelagicales bacterium]|nr:lysine--tRNA ligase [Candidatus Nanopelagicales bacterium]
TFIDIFAGLGIHPDRYYWMSDIYPTGEMDPFLRTALDRAQVVRDVYRRVSKVERPEGWLPVQAVCPSCGKVGTTIALDWDGETVRVECRPGYVTWASSCGFEGRVSPFGGNAKLYWNLEWAAQWSILGVTIEPCGKDLATAGGSRDRADAIAREVFDREPPRNLAYEFLNIGGRKMSTSKGRGASAQRMAEVLPPEPLRLLFLRPRPNQAIEFEPEGTDAIPRLFDELDKLAAAVAGRPYRGELPSDPERLFGYVQLADASVAEAAAAYRPAFGHLALLAQIPGVEIAARVAEEKGAPLTPREERTLAERLAAARAWLESYAPESAVVRVRRDALPPEAPALGEDQRVFLGGLALAAGKESPHGGDAWQTLLFRVAEDAALPAGRAFGAVYLAFLGRPNGPRAGWLLASLESPFVIARLRAAAGWHDHADEEATHGEEAGA